MGFDLETTGTDRFNDAPVSFALVHVEAGVVVRSWSGLINPGRSIPAEATEVHGISTERARTKGMPLGDAVALLSDVVLAAGRHGVPLVGMRLDYDLTLLESQSVRLCRRGLVARGWLGPVLDVAVIDRHVDERRPGRRTLSDLCAHYGIEITHAHDATADAIASIEVLFAMAVRYETLWTGDAASLHLEQVRWHREWSEGHDGWRRTQGLVPTDPRDHLWPLVPIELPPAA